MQYLIIVSGIHLESDGDANVKTAYHVNNDNSFESYLEFDIDDTVLSLEPAPGAVMRNVQPSTAGLTVSEDICDDCNQVGKHQMKQNDWPTSSVY